MAGLKIYRPLFLLVVYIAITSVLCEVHPDGVSDQVSNQDGLGNYQFSYSVNNGDGEHFRQEGTDAEGRVVGSYGLTETDGRHRIVDYVADASGFRAHIRSNEPGMAASNPAAVTVDKTGYPGASSHLDIAATSLSPHRGSTQSVPNGVFGARITPLQTKIPYQQAVVSDRSYLQRPVNPPHFQHEGVAAAVEIPHIKQQPASSNSETPHVYRPPLHPSQAVKPPGYHQSDSPLGVQNQFQSLPNPAPTSLGYYPPPYSNYDTPYPPITNHRNELNRYPQVSMSTVHGGLGRTPYIAVPQQQQHLGVSQLPSNVPYQQGYSPSHSARPLVSGVDGSTVSTQGANRPNIVLRAMPIPNGIQAVPVDSATGQVYSGSDYPIYGNQDISSIQGFNRAQARPNSFRQTDYDDTPSSQRNYGRPEYQRTSSLPETRGQADTTNYRNNVRASLPVQPGSDYNRNIRPHEPPSFSSPSARDLAAISGHLGYGNNLNYNYPAGANSFQSNPYFNYQNAPNGNGYPGYHGLTDIGHPGYQNGFLQNSSPEGYNPYYGSSPYPPSTLYNPYAKQYDPQTTAPRYQDPNRYASNSELKPVIDLAPAASSQSDKVETSLTKQSSSEDDETFKSD